MYKANVNKFVTKLKNQITRTIFRYSHLIQNAEGKQRKPDKGLNVKSFKSILLSVTKCSNIF